MNLIDSFPLFCIILSLLCSAVSSVLKPKAAKWLTFCLSGTIIFLSACAFFRTYLADTAITFKMGHFPAPWGNEIRFGPLETLIALSFSVVFLLCVIGGNRHLKLSSGSDRLNLYYVMADLVMAAVMSLTYTNDIFTGYVFIEICTIASTGLLIVRGMGHSLAAATRYMIFSLIGSGLYLFGIILLYDITGQLLMVPAHEAVSALWATGEYHFPLTVIISMIVAGLGIKSGLFPFHFWMPDTYGTAPAGSAGILSGIVAKVYIFLLIKIIYRVVGTDVFYESGVNKMFFVLGAAEIIIGSISAIQEKSIDRMTAYSSAAQIGYIYLGLGISIEAGVVAAIFQIIAHSVTKPLLFLAASGLCEASGGNRDFESLRGAGLRDRFSGICFTAGSLSLVGIPLFAGFVVKLLLASAGIQEGGAEMYVSLAVLAISTILNTLYFLRTVICIYTKSDNKERLPLSAHIPLAASMAILLAINITLGLFSTPVVEIIKSGLNLF